MSSWQSILAIFALWSTVALSLDVVPSVSSDASGKVELHVPNGICFTTGKSQNQSAQSPQSIRGPKGDRGDTGPAGRDGKDGRDGVSGGSCSPGGGGSGNAMAFSLFESPEYTWMNMNRSRVPTIGKDQVVGIVTFGMEKYYHEQIEPQYICHFENEDGNRLYSTYSPVEPYKRNTIYYNIGCELPDATEWPSHKRRATVTVWYQNRTEVIFKGRPGHNQIDFMTWWSSFSYTISTGVLIIRGDGFNPSVTYTATFTWPNGTVLSLKAKPNAFKTVIFNLKAYQNGFVGKNSVPISIDSPSGPVAYQGNSGGDEVVLQGPTSHSACKTATLLKDTWRKKSNRDQSNIICDQRNLAVGWYRFDASIGGKMPESCVQPNSCGTATPGWLKGTHPSTVGVEVSDTVCFSWAGNCCNWNIGLKVVNCGAYYVYYFNKTPICSAAYCTDA